MMKVHQYVAPEKCITTADSFSGHRLRKHEDTAREEKENSFAFKKPLFSDFTMVEKDARAIFPYRFAVYNGNYGENIVKVVHPRGYTRIKIEEDDSIANLSFIWKPTGFSPKFWHRIDQVNYTRKYKNHLVVNHIEGISTVATKTGILRCLRKLYSASLDAVSFHYTVHESTPTSFILVSGSQEADYQAFLQRFKELNKKYYVKERIPAKHCRQNIWLIKPAAMNQGKGIEIFNDNLAEMKTFIESKPAFTHWVVQKYIERPLLYKGRKFDIRIWAVVTWKEELMYYKHGYLRTSSEIYSLDSRYNYVHLTNNCLQKFGNKYGAFEEGNTVSFETFKLYLKEEFPRLALDFDSQMVPRMKDLMIDTFLSAKGVLNPMRRRNCFELLGFDFLIDEDFRIWLIEVNTNPYLGIPNPLIEGIMPKMLNDLFELLNKYISKNSSF